MTANERAVLKTLFFIRPKGSQLLDTPKGVCSSLMKKGFIWSLDGGFGKVYMISDEGIEAYLQE